VSNQTEAASIAVVVNGAVQAIPPGLNVLRLLQHVGVEPARVAVELNRQIVRKSDWAATPVEAGAQVEIVQFVGGG
jgi:sulfur carrier protein